MRSFPLPYTAGHQVYVPGAEDSHGNPIDTWADPVPVQCFWWTPDSSEPILAGHDRLIVDRVLVLDSADAEGVSHRDRFTIEGRLWEAIGIAEDYDHGPWWSPGVRPVNLQRVVG